MPRLLLLLAVLLCAARADDTKVGALGHIEPAGGLVELVGFGDVVTAVPVQPNQLVQRGETLIEFASHLAATTELKLAQFSLDETTAAAPRGLASRERSFAIAERDLELARERLARYEQLAASSIAPQELAARRRNVSAGEANLQNLREEIAQNRLATKLALERAQLNVALAEEHLARSSLRAPSDGTVLEIRAHPGEAGGGPLVRFADLSRIVVVAEVFEVDLPRVKVGARCEIEHRVFPQKLAGRVESIGRIVNAQTKAVRVRVALDQADPASRFLGLEVNVSIAP